jgi:SAM-dependent methyltransferase
MFKQHLQQLTVSAARRLFTRCPHRTSGWRSKLFDIYDRSHLDQSSALDLGCGRQPRNPFNCRQSRGIDIRSSDHVIEHDLLQGPLPIESDSIDAITAFDVLEHVPRVIYERERGGTRFPVVELMNEVSRCLRPGGVFFSSTPCFPWPMAFHDPTHVNFMTEDTLRVYFCGDSPRARIYGFGGNFRMVEGFWIDYHFNCLLAKP